MKDRIEVNGEWYVKENTIKTSQKKMDIDDVFNITRADTKTYESNLYCFEVVKIMEEEGVFYKGCSIELTDKRTSPFKEEYLDNERWFIGVLNNTPDSMKDANEIFCSEGLEQFKLVIEDLIKIGWLENEQ